MSIDLHLYSSQTNRFDGRLTHHFPSIPLPWLLLDGEEGKEAVSIVSPKLFRLDLFPLSLSRAKDRRIKLPRASLQPTRNHQHGESANRLCKTT